MSSLAHLYYIDITELAIVKFTQVFHSSTGSTNTDGHLFFLRLWYFHVPTIFCTCDFANLCVCKDFGRNYCYYQIYMYVVYNHIFITAQGSIVQRWPGYFCRNWEHTSSYIVHLKIRTHNFFFLQTSENLLNV